jgi:serine/threonine-protein kinase HipA
LKVTAQVLLHDQHIGDIASDGKICTFKLLESYKQDADRDTLSLSLFTMQPERLAMFESVAAPLPAFIKILLPEGKVREQLIEDSGMVIGENSFAADVYLLDLCGADLSGAVSVVNVEHSQVYDDFRQEVIKAETPEKARTLSGAQEKFSVNKYKGKLVLPYDGESGSYIAKPQPNHVAKLPNLVLNEYLHMKLASRMGLEIPDVEVIYTRLKDDEEERPFFVIKRFDRTDAGQKIHMEEIHQILNTGSVVSSDSKYDDFSYAEIISFLHTVDKRLNTNITYEYLKELVFSVLIGNADFHLKNSALIYPDKKLPSKAPSYDLLNTEIYGFRRIPVCLYDAVQIDVNDFDEESYHMILKKAGIKQPEFESLFARFQEKIYAEFLALIENDEILSASETRGFIDQIDYRLRNLKAKK